MKLNCWLTLESASNSEKLETRIKFITRSKIKFICKTSKCSIPDHYILGLQYQGEDRFWRNLKIDPKDKMQDLVAGDSFTLRFNFIKKLSWKIYINVQLSRILNYFRRNK